MSRHTRRRLTTVVLAAAAALAAWALIRLAGVDLAVDGGTRTVGAGDVVAAALAGGLAGSLVLPVIVRYACRPLRAWILVATTALSVSTIGPGRMADDGTAVALMALHFVVAIVVITGFAGTLPVCRGRAHAARGRSATMSV